MTPTPAFSIRLMTGADIDGVVGLQKLAFPPPFSEDLHWDPEHIAAHLSLFSEAQWVATIDGHIIGSCSNARISEASWQAHGSWGATMGGPMLRNFDPTGSTLYGLDITVHPDARKQGVGRAFYQARYQFVQDWKLTRYGTGCRLPDFRQFATSNPRVSVEEYAKRVVEGEVVDRTLTPLLTYKLKFLGVIENYMEDIESANAAALLEWNP